MGESPQAWIPAASASSGVTVALTAALLLATALVYVGFSAGNKEVTASQLLTTGKAGQTYELAGTVLDGSGPAPGHDAAVRIRDPKLNVSVPVS